jgi:hypothetical protein
MHAPGSGVVAGADQAIVASEAGFDTDQSFSASSHFQILHRTKRRENSHDFFHSQLTVL